MIPTEKSHLHCAALSHPGETGKNNEDRYFLGSYRLEVNGRPSVLAIVADGIGGHHGGETASRLAVETSEAALRDSTGREPVAHLRDAVHQAGKAILRMSEANTDLAGMGSTIVMAWILGDRLYGAWVGDSRAYLLRQDGLHQITSDHTWIQEALDAAVITPEEVADHPHAHVLLRYLGSRPLAEPDLRLRLAPDDEDHSALGNQGMGLRPGDQVLLCSDGLTDLVHGSEIEATLRSSPPDQAVQALTDQARERGGHDNITVVILAVPKSPRRPKAGCLRVFLATLLAIPVLLLLVGFLAAALRLLGFWPW
jgi:serine/threonine protein phosphatase PrpC